MKVGIGINGFGRIGRLVFRADSAKAGAYNYDILRRGEVAAKGVKTREAKKETK